LSASRELTHRLFEGADESPLALVLRFAQEGAQADAAAFVLAEPDGDLRIVAAADVLGDVVGQVIPGEGSLAAAVIAGGEPILADDYNTDYHP
jgi:hypothetical protein